MLFDNNDFDISFLVGGYPNIENKKLVYTKEEGFLKGNMWVDEYKPYKNYNAYVINPRNEKELLILKLYELDFAINDLNLYLDLYPSDKEIYNLFVKYNKEYEEVKNSYEKLYGPLCLTDTDYNNYKWDDNPWPWDKMSGGSMYV